MNSLIASSAYSTAVISVVSALIGGAIGTVSTLVTDRRRAERDDSRAAAAEASEILQAARLVAEELNAIRDEISQAAQSGVYWVERGRLLPTATWNRYSPVMARLDGMTWRVSADAYGSANRANWLAESEPAGARRAPADVDELRRTWRSATYAISLIQHIGVGTVGAFGLVGYRDPEEIEQEIWGDRKLPEDLRAEQFQVETDEPGYV